MIAQKKSFLHETREFVGKFSKCSEDAAFVGKRYESPCIYICAFVLLCNLWVNEMELEIQLL
jgi:hypothetical protein